MAGLLEQMRAAEQARNRGLLTHTPQRPVTGRQVADAMQSVGLLASPIPIVGDVAGLMGDAAMYAAKPEERTAGNMALTALGALPFVPSAAGAARKAAKTLDISEEARAARMAEQKYTRGIWRGGKSIADGRYFTPVGQEAAANFAKRHGPDADIREYALRLGNQFDASADFGPDDLKRIAEFVKPYNPQLAKYLPDMADDYRVTKKMPGGALWKVLQTQTGGNELDVLRAAGYDSINAGQEIIMINMGNVRDANKAAFDPRHLGKFGPFLGVAGVGLLGGMNEDSSR